MKICVVGNVARRTEIKGGKKSKPELAGSYINALIASRLGHDVTLISRLPNPIEKDMLGAFKKFKIKLENYTAWKETCYESTYDKNMEKTTKILSDSGPIVKVKQGDYDVVIISSYYGYVGSEVLKTLKTQDNVLILDVQSYIKHRGADGMLVYKPWLDKEKYLKYVDIIKLNVKELFYLTGKVSLNSASDLLKLGPKMVILTLQDRYNYIFYEKTYLKIPFYKHDAKPKYRLGLGEMYDTAFSINYAETRNPKEAGFFAEAAMSLCMDRNCIKKPLTKTEINKRFKLLKDIFLA